MLPTPSSSPRVVLEDCLNVDRTPAKRQHPHLPTPPKTAVPSRKRPAKKQVQEKSRKKAKVCAPVETDAEEESEEEDPNLFEESDEDEPRVLPCRARRQTVFHTQSSFTSSLAHKYRGSAGMAIVTVRVVQPLTQSLDSFDPTNSSIIRFITQERHLHLPVIGH